MTTYHPYAWYALYAGVILLLPLFALFVLKIFQRLTLGKCKSLVCLNGKTAIVTGGCSGIGFETALALASRGCRVIIADKADGTEAKEKIVSLTNNTNVVVKHMDLSSLQSVRDFAADINATEDRLDILINNAGVATGGNGHTKDGLHVTMQVNHFGPFLLTHLLVDLLKKSAPSRIVFVSSIMAFTHNLSIKNLNPNPKKSLSYLDVVLTYSNSKLCTVISSNAFAKKLRSYGVTSNCVHPGLVVTPIFDELERMAKVSLFERFVGRPFLLFLGKTPQEGAQTSIHLALSNTARTFSGKYCLDCIPFFQPRLARNKEFCQDVWEQSEKMVKLEKHEKLE